MVMFPFDFRDYDSESDRDEPQSNFVNQANTNRPRDERTPDAETPSVEVPIETSWGVVHFVVKNAKDESDHTLATAPASAYDVRELSRQETKSTGDDSSRGRSMGTHINPASETGRLYEKSGRRRRRDRRRFMCIGLILVGVLMMGVSVAIGMSNRNGGSSDAFSSANTPKNPSPPVGESFTIGPAQSPDIRPSPVTNPSTVISPTVYYDPDESFPADFPQGIILASDRFLERGDFVASPSGEYHAGLDQNGNFILEDRYFNVIWSAGTNGAYRVFMQSGGNVVVRDRNREALWTSGTHGQEGAVLVVDDGGQISVMSGPTPVWIDGIPREVYTGPSSEDLVFPSRGIFYYPWFPQTWTINGQPIKFEPDLGLYSSSDPEIARAHIDAMTYAHIDLSIASWWGPGTNLDRARLPLLMDEAVAMGSPLKFTVYHEDERDLQPSVDSIRDDLEYLKKWFAWHPAWAHVDGKPVIFVYNGSGCDIVNRWMDASNGEWFVVLKIFPKFKDCPRQPDNWHQYGVHGGEPLEYDTYSFSIAPGFWKADEEAARTPRVGQSRWCTNAELLSQSDEPWHLIVSFNEAGEGTNIESSPHWSSDSGYGYYLDCLNQYPTVR